MRNIGGGSGFSGKTMFNLGLLSRVTALDGQLGVLELSGNTDKQELPQQEAVFRTKKRK